KKGLTIAPGRDDMRMLLAQTFLRANRTADARDVLSIIERSTSDQELRKRATKMLDQTEQITTFTEITPGIEKELEKERAAEVRATPPPPPAVSSPKETVLEALTPIGPSVEGEKVTGLLINLDCASGLTLRVRTDRGTLDFHSPQPEKIQFLSYPADTTDKQVEFPGIVLEPGTYVIRVKESGEKRSIVEILNQNEKQILATLLAVTDHRQRPDDNSEFVYFDPTPRGPQAVRTWFYTGDLTGLEFVYPRSRARVIAKANDDHVMASNSSSRDDVIVAITPNGKEVVIDDP